LQAPWNSYPPDHGEAFLEHEDVRRHSHSLFQEELRVPLILSAPGLSARRLGGLTRTVDLMPTLLELFALQARPGQMIGRSLMPKLMGEQQASEPFLAELRLKPAPKGKHSRAVMDGRWKLIERLSGGYALYDQLEDPLETNDVSGERGEEVRRLVELMLKLEAEAVQHAAAFAPGAAVEHSADEAAQIKDLGYGGDDEEEEEDPGH
jgi:arylsulfatase A-like enzyme